MAPTVPLMVTAASAGSVYWVVTPLKPVTRSSWPPPTLASTLAIRPSAGAVPPESRSWTRQPWLSTEQTASVYPPSGSMSSAPPTLLPAWTSVKRSMVIAREAPLTLMVTSSAFRLVTAPV